MRASESSAARLTSGFDGMRRSFRWWLSVTYFASSLYSASLISTSDRTVIRSPLRRNWMRW
jgi:hypothetical protein